MTTLCAWIEANTDIMKDCIDLIIEKRDNIDILIIQLWALKKHTDSMIDFLERQRRIR